MSETRLGLRKQSTTPRHPIAKASSSAGSPVDDTETVAGWARRVVRVVVYSMEGGVICGRRARGEAALGRDTSTM